jgi:hypothetical protein
LIKKSISFNAQSVIVVMINNNNSTVVRFLSSALMYFRFSLLRDAAWRRLVVGYRRFGTISFPSSQERHFEKNGLLDPGKRQINCPETSASSCQSSPAASKKSEEINRTLFGFYYLLLKGRE